MSLSTQELTESENKIQLCLISDKVESRGPSSIFGEETMKSKLIVSLAAVSLLALAGCGESEQKSEQPPAKVEQPAPAPAAPAATQAPAAPMNAEETLKKIKDQAATMTAEQKQAAVATARKAAEDAATAAGQTADQVKAAADSAEKAIKDALGVQ